MACAGCKKAAEINKLAMAAGAFKAAGRAVRAKINGKPVFSAAQMVMERMKICNDCPDNKYIREQDRCAVCGCFLLKSILGAPGKVTLAQEKCPRGHW
jgi:hypothetical protein